MDPASRQGAKRENGSLSSNSSFHSTHAHAHTRTSGPTYQLMKTSFSMCVSLTACLCVKLRQGLINEWREEGIKTAHKRDFMSLPPRSSFQNKSLPFHQFRFNKHAKFFCINRNTDIKRVWGRLLVTIQKSDSWAPQCIEWSLSPSSSLSWSLR